MLNLIDFQNKINEKAGGKDAPSNILLDDTSIEISNISGEYCAIIPEWIINDMGWYEDTKLSWKIDDGNVIITEEDE